MAHPARKCFSARRWMASPNRGQALVEFCFVFPILVLVMVALIHFSLVAWFKMQIHRANHEGAVYGSYHPGDEKGITATVRKSMPDCLDASVLSTSITWEDGERQAGSLLTVLTVCDMQNGYGLLPGGSLMPHPRKIAVETTIPVLVN